MRLIRSLPECSRRDETISKQRLPLLSGALWRWALCCWKSSTTHRIVRTGVFMQRAFRLLAQKMAALGGKAGKSLQRSHDYPGPD
jgi:hypothetical protein